jgi:hypothetical protein
MLVICLFLLFRTYKEFNVQQNGFFIKVRVDKIPISCKFSTKKRIKAFFEFEYNGKNHSKNLKQHCDLRVGDLIILKTNEESEIFLFEDENLYSELISILMLILIGLIILFKSLK